jgi:putative transposase
MGTQDAGASPAHVAIFLQMLVSIMYMNIYDSEKHHKRAIRLKDLDFSQKDAYFITLYCTAAQQIFGTVEYQQVFLLEPGVISQNEWEKLPSRFEQITLSALPDRLHFILLIDKNTQTNSIGDIIGAYKSAVFTKIENWILLNRRSFTDKNFLLVDFWHPKHEKYILQNKTEYHKIIQYIRTAPAYWLADTEPPRPQGKKYADFVEYIVQNNPIT